MSNAPFKLKELTTWVTSECDLRCKYCFVYKLNENQPHGKMTKETADQLIKFADQNLQPDGNIWFFGAEPFCNFDIIRYIVEKSKETGHKWKFGATTNCTLLTEEIVQWLKKQNFGFNCSIDGLSGTHNTNRIYPNGSGSWDDAWRGLSLIRKYINPNPQVRWTVTPSTVKGLADGIKTLVEEHKLTSLAVDFVYEANWTQTNLAILRSELEIFRGYYEKWMAQGIPVFSMFMRDANAALTQADRRWYSRCGLGEGAVGVDYDGTLYPCHRFIDSHEVKIGDIYKGFYTNRADWTQHWRNVAPYCETPKKCPGCNYKKACIGGCIAMNFDVFGEPHANPEMFCTIKQLIVEVLGDSCIGLRNNQTFQGLYAKPQQRPIQLQNSTKNAANTSKGGDIKC
jgi:uncharacterized protein